jgi:hypothetical protein
LTFIEQGKQLKPNNIGQKPKWSEHVGVPERSEGVVVKSKQWAFNQSRSTVVSRRSPDLEARFQSVDPPLRTS